MTQTQPAPMTLSEAELADIRAAAGHYPEPAAAAIEALKIVQAHRRWVSDEAIHAIATELGISPADLDSVATFYNLIYRKPVGENVIHYCDSVSCWMLGADDLRDGIARRLGIRPGETTADGRYTLLPICCLGACDHAPVLMLDGETVGDVDANRLDTLFGGEVRHG